MNPRLARILIIDDQAPNVRLLERILRKEGYEQLRAVLDSSAAVAAAEQFRPDLVLLDLIMQPLSGLEVLDQLRLRIPESEYLPILVLTADNSPESRHQALACGASDFLTKPIDALEVTLRIRNLLETRRLHLELQAQNRKLEETVQARTKRLSEQARLMNLASDALVAFDLEDRIIYWNQGAERLYGWQATEVAGKRADEFLTRDLAQEDEVRRALQKAGEWDGELRHTRKDGTELVVHSRRTLVQDEEHRPFAQLCVNTDISALKSLQRQVQLAQRMESVGAMAAGVAHDLNNMLTPILMGVGLLRANVQDSLSCELLQTMRLSAECGQGLVKQLLTFVRGTGEQPGELHLPVLLKEIGNLLQKTFPRHINLNLDLQRDLPLVRMELTHMYQVIMNLCINARDAMPGGGELTLATSVVTVDATPAQEKPESVRPGSYVRLTVQDTGIGIPRELHERIFEPFFTTKPPDLGTGLGLSTVANIVARRGGFVALKSEPGQGASFHVHLPAVVPGGETPTFTVEEPVFTGRGEWILVVEDEASIREVIRSALEASGYKVLAASNGIEGASMAAQHPEIQLVLTDLIMPGMDGPGLLRAVHQTRPDLPAILVSGDDALVSAAGGLGGLKATLPKPFTAAELLALIRHVLDGDA